MSEKADRQQKLTSLALQQLGYFTAQQAKDIGYSYRVQSYHRKLGNWLEIERGIFRLPNYPQFPEEDFVICSLWSRNNKGVPQAVISHETALTIHGLGDLMPGKIHCIVPPKFRKKSEAYVLHKDILKPEDVQSLQGFQVTKPIKTIIDVAEGTTSPEHIEKALRDGIRKGFFIFENFNIAQMSQKAEERIRQAMDAIKING